jgi:hypothetical protein
LNLSTDGGQIGNAGPGGCCGGATDIQHAERKLGGKAEAMPHEAAGLERMTGDKIAGATGSSGSESHLRRILRQLPLQGAAMQAEQLRRLRNIAVAIRQHPLNVLPFDPR